MGLRIGEAVALRASHFDLENDFLTIEEQWSEHSRDYIEPKTEASQRTIFLDDEHMDFDLIRTVIYPIIPKDPDAFIFTQEENGKPLKSNNVSQKVLPRAIARCVDEEKKLTIKEITPHDMRRTFGTQFMMDGGNLWRLHQILGHEDFNVTRKHYAKFSLTDAQRQRKILRRQGNVIEGNFPKGANEGGQS